MPKINLAEVEESNRTGYPAPYADAVQGRWVRKLAPAMDLTDFGVSHVVLKPGAISAQRHWHEDEDEFVVLLSGRAVLVQNGGRVPMGPGDMAAFPKGDPDAHHLRNESEGDCTFLAFGRAPVGDAHYPDIDLKWTGGKFTRRDGSGF